MYSPAVHVRAIVVAFLLCASAPLLFAQKRVEAGIFLDYLGISQTNTHNFGLGGRFGFRIHRHVMFEGEAAYDYGINFNEALRNITNADISAIQRTSVGVTHGLFGLKFQPTRERGLHPFVTAKAGFVDFRLSPSLLPLGPAGPVESTLLGIRTSNLNLSLYPGAGVEATLGPLGLRLEMGDEIYVNRSAHNNLRITFGPILRF